MMFGRNPRLPNQSVFDSIRIPPTDAEIEKLQHARLEHIKNLESYRQEANAKALARLEAEADKRDGEMVERSLGIGDLVLCRNERESKLHPRWDGPFIIYDVSDKNTYQLMTRNGYILRHLYNGNRIRPYFQRVDRRYLEVPDSALWYSSGDLQRRDAQHRLRTSRLPARQSSPKGSNRLKDPVTSLSHVKAWTRRASPFQASASPTSAGEGSPCLPLPFKGPLKPRPSLLTSVIRLPSSARCTSTAERAAYFSVHHWHYLATQI
jgi:hypothetical protein